MKTVFLIRHAKSSWKNPGQDDFDRPLNQRGKADLLNMSERFSKRENCPEFIYASPAKRTKKTAVGLAKSFGLSKTDVIFEPRLYQFSTINAHLELIWQQEDEASTICIVGHNNSLNDLANYLSGESVSHLVTLSIVKLEFNSNKWLDVQEGTAKLIYHDYPKKNI